MTRRRDHDGQKDKADSQAAGGESYAHCYTVLRGDIGAARTLIQLVVNFRSGASELPALRLPTAFERT
jgi:hypothetical protein